jgi:hypothetical protein
MTDIAGDDNIAKGVDIVEAKDQGIGFSRCSR